MAKPLRVHAFNACISEVRINIFKLVCYEIYDILVLISHLYKIMSVILDLFEQLEENNNSASIANTSYYCSKLSSTNMYAIDKNTEGIKRNDGNLRNQWC